MVPAIPSELVTSAAQMMIYFVTVVASVVSFLLTARA
jgi:hypothetical protein